MDKQQIQECDPPSGEIKRPEPILVRLLLQPARQQVGRATASVHLRHRRAAQVSRVPVRRVSAAETEEQDTPTVST